MTDEKLLQRASGGDEAAFLILYERHRAPIFRFAYRLLGSIELAEDVTHDCFLGLIKRSLCKLKFNEFRGLAISVMVQPEMEMATSGLR